MRIFRNTSYKSSNTSPYKTCLLDLILLIFPSSSFLTHLCETRPSELSFLSGFKEEVCHLIAWHLSMYLSVCVEARSQTSGDIPQETVYLISRQGLCFARNSLIWLGWLASNSQGSDCLHYPSADSASVCHLG